MTTLTPAYGRDYKSKKAVMVDLEAGKDFIVNDMSDPYDGKPCSPLQDFAGKSVVFRYGQLRKVFALSIPA